ncbi:hypothetical protein [Methylobacterium sp. sgz302541]|uniref:hypothetical protein n=1 Tax=unclassified Methylobacterium TaxID=2615210 RepID=UPI003D33F7B5
MTLSLRAAALAVLALGAMAESAIAGEPLARHRCEILSRLTRIHEAGPRDTSYDRFIAVELHGRPQSYVQCIFLPSDTRMLCEASSGAYRFRPEDGLRLRQSEESIAALKALGFVRKDVARNFDEAKNFEREVELGTPPDLGAVADLILAALSRGYAAEPNSRLDITAPKAKGFDGRCNPLAALK